MKKRFLAILLAVVMCLVMATPAFAAEAPTSGKCGENVTWTLNANGTLTISGTGSMADYERKPVGLFNLPNTPWYGQRDKITSVVINNGVTSIGAFAFTDCVNMTSVTIPNSVTSIGAYAFLHCIRLTSVTIPDRVTSIGAYAFYECTGLTSVTIPDSVTSIESDTFCRCTGLTSVTIPDSVTSIGVRAFCECTGLTSVTIPNSVTYISRYAFEDCANLKDVYYGETEAQWKVIDIGSDNAPLNSATIHYNSTGPSTQPTTPTQPTNPTPTTNLPTVENIPATGTAVASTQTVKLDGKDVQFQYYGVKDANGNLSNYVKVRDLANALNGTKAQFNVGWNGKISITSSTPYQVAGGEGTTPYSGNQSYKSASNTPVSFNGSDVKLTSFQLFDSKGSGYTYYKLRDLGQLLNFNVKWDNAAKIMIIETDKPYTG